MVAIESLLILVSIKFVKHLTSMYKYYPKLENRWPDIDVKVRYYVTFKYTANSIAATFSQNVSLITATKISEN